MLGAVMLIAAAGLAAPAAGFEAQTPWPEASPCARPQTIAAGPGLSADVLWSSADGAQAITLARDGTGEPARIGRPLRSARLARVTSAAALPADGWLLRIACQSGATVAWGPCPGGRCQVTARYPAPLVPAPWRLHPWLRPRRSPDGGATPDARNARFFTRIARTGAADPGTARSAVAMTRDLAGDLLDLLRVACPSDPRDRCTPPLRAANEALAAFLIAGEGSRAGAVHREGAAGQNGAWRWTVTGGDVTLDVDCDETGERSAPACGLSLPVAEGLRLRYRPRGDGASEGVDLVRVDPSGAGGGPIGTIRFLRSDGGRVWVEVARDALALRADPARP